ncbi:DUF7547 family protein [Halorussus halophilus]|uniref:DUF7547 family protein n=1 Tax=Halorussus halophilus TaxID=2650975 RepID=UPI001787F853|nr:hypothetical protein [Halorussus halophilus]
MSDRRDDWDDEDDPEELDERVADLEARMRDLRTEMTRPPEGPMGLPRPPTPREVLSFTGEYAIPTVIAILEANIRALEMLQQVVKVLDPNHSVTEEGRDRLESRAADASRATLDRLESALGEVETAINEGNLPREGEARDILQDARRINRDIRDRVRESQERADEARANEREERDRDSARAQDRDAPPTDIEDRGTTIELDGDDGDDEEDDRGQVDVDAELRSIKDEIDGPEADGDDEVDDQEDLSEDESTDADTKTDADARTDEDAEADNDDSDDE